MKFSNDVEKYEIEVTKMGQNYSFFLQCDVSIVTHSVWFRNEGHNVRTQIMFYTYNRSGQPHNI